MIMESNMSSDTTTTTTTLPAPTIPSSTTTTNSSTTTTSTPVLKVWLEHLRHQIMVEQQQEQSMMEQQRQEQERRLQSQVEQERIRQEREERIRQEEAERLAQEQAILHQRAEQLRQERLARQEAEQTWVRSITVSPEGVQQQIQLLKQSTADDLPAQRIALQSLYQIFQQIQAHPEEPNFRRIRRNHEQFIADVGRHKGGQEILIAAGFTLGSIDDVPCFLCIEPNLEEDMDGWSTWFDLLKATFQLLEQEIKPAAK